TEPAQRRDDIAGGAWALDVGLRDDDVCAGKARNDGRHDVALRRCVVPRDDSDRARDARQGSLALGREQTLGGEFRLQPLQPRKVIAQAEWLDRERAQAEVAALLEELRPAEDVNAIAVRELDPEPVEATARHRDAEARPVARILEREEDALPALVTAELRDLALDPHARQAPEPGGHTAVERRDGEDLAVAVV